MGNSWKVGDLKENSRIRMERSLLCCWEGELGMLKTGARKLKMIRNGKTCENLKEGAGGNLG